MHNVGIRVPFGTQAGYGAILYLLFDLTHTTRSVGVSGPFQPPKGWILLLFTGTDTDNRVIKPWVLQ